MNCELCGQETDNLKKVIIEYSALRVCPKCSKFGKVVNEPVVPTAKDKKTALERISTSSKRWVGKDVFEETGKKELVIDYSERVKKGRLSRGWTPEQFGKIINEKKSIITKLEAGELKPDEKLISKLEKTLNIKLMEEVKEIKVKKKKSRPRVLGDIVRIK